jgi:AbrB family looped-hinge helix DNA binding protein
MSVATIKLSSKGQIVIPKEIRDELHWEEGTQLMLVSSLSGVTLKTAPKKIGGTVGDLIGMLRHDGPPIPIETLCRPVDYRAEWEESEQRSQ